MPGPMGGGNSFLNSMLSGLVSRGHKVFFDLNCKELDIILILDPRWNHSNCAFTTRDILRYLGSGNQNTLIVHRINECDERKNTNFMNKKLRQVNYIADSTIFVGQWLLNLDLQNPKSFHELDTVIKNGVDKTIFNNSNFQPWLGNGVLKIVTHHWSNNPMKGFDIYEQFDLLLSKENYRNKYSFTYIGNLPKKFKFKNSAYIEPLYSHALAKKLKEQHGYLTASINEPGGNHQNEGAACGLPLLYRDSGCLPEYCEGYGVMFNENNFELKLTEFYNNYSKYSKVMEYYPHTSDIMIEKYISHFELLLEKKNFILGKRQISRINKAVLRLRFPM